MTKKRVLIQSIGHQLGSARANSRPKAKGPGNRIISDFSLSYAIAYARAFEERGWNVEVACPKLHVDAIDRWAVEYDGQLWKDYDRVILLYCTANFFGGTINAAWLPVLDQIEHGDVGDCDLIFFTDDSGNRPSNPFLVWERRMKSGTIKGFNSKRDSETHGHVLDMTEERWAKVKKLVDWSVSDKGPRVMMSGGEVSVRRWPKDQYGFGPGERNFVDHTATFYGAVELTYGWDQRDPLPPEEMEYDALYAGAKRKGRTNLMVPIFERPDLKTLSILRFDRAKYDLDIESWPNHTDDFVVPTKDSPELHSKCWVVPIVGDVWQVGQQVSSRYWFSMQIPTVAAIQISYDPERQLVKDKWLRDQMYYETPEELAALIAKVKADPKYRLKLIKAQRAERPEFNEELFA